MNFLTGEQIVHSQFGVGKIILIKSMRYNNSQPRLFYQVEFDKTTVWIPVDNTSTGELRPITSENELDRYRTLLKSHPAERRVNVRGHQPHPESPVGYGTFEGLCEAVRDLSAWHRSKPLNLHEKDLLNLAWKTLAAEWSAASGLSVNEAQAEIDGCLSAGRV